MISAVVLSKNEEKDIERCLNSLSFCDEVILIDDYSTDKTLDIAKKHTAVIFQNHLDNNFSQQRNFGLSKAKNEWVVFVDADEVVSNQLQEEIKKVVAESKSQGFYIQRKDFLFGNEMRYGDTGNVSIIRLGRKENGSWTGQVHETWRIQGKIEKLKHAIMHYPHQSISEFLSEINFYSTVRAEELFHEKERSSIFQIIFYPKAKFLHLFVLKLGFLDGTAGVVHAVMMSLYSFLVRGKLYLVQGK